MAYTPATTSSLVTLTHTSGTANITSNGKKLWALTINGAGGTTQLLDDILVNAGQNAILTVTSGIFDANTHAITANLFQFSGSTTRSVILGGTLTVGGNVTNTQSIFFCNNTTGLTFTKNSANIVVLAMAVGGQVQVSFTGPTAGLTLNDVTFNATTNRANIALNGANTYAHLTINSGWTVYFTNNPTISNAFTWIGKQANPILLAAPSTAQVTISVASGTNTLSFGGLINMVGAGGATFIANNCYDFGNNSGWSISPPADSTAVLTAAEVTTLGRIIDGVASGTVTTGGSTTSIPTSALAFGGVAATGVVSNQFAGRTVEFDRSTTTAGLRGVLSAISASTASDTPTLTVATLPATPVSGDTFVII